MCTAKCGPLSLRADLSRVDTAVLLASLRRNRRALALYVSKLPLIDRAICKVGNGTDGTGELWDAGSRSLAIAALHYQGAPDAFNPFAFIKRAIFSRVKSLSNRGDRRRTARGVEELTISGREPTPLQAVIQAEERGQAEQILGPLDVGINSEGAINGSDVRKLVERQGLADQGSTARNIAILTHLVQGKLTGKPRELELPGNRRGRPRLTVRPAAKARRRMAALAGASR